MKTRACTVLFAALVGVTGSVVAQQSTDQMAQSGRDGQTFGDTLVRNPPQLQYKPGGDKNAGTVTINGDTVPINQIAPGADQAQIDKLQQLKGATQAQLDAAVEQKKQELARDPDADAWRTAMKIKPHSEQETANNPMWQQTLQTVSQSNLSALAGEYVACKANTRFYVTNSDGKAMTHEQSCEVLNIPQNGTIAMNVSTGATQTVTIYDQTSDVTADMTLPFDGTAGVQSLLTATYDLTWSGDVANVSITNYPTQFNNWRGTLSITYNTAAPGTTQHATYKLVAYLVDLQVDVSANPPNPLMGSDGWCTAHWTCTDSTQRTLDGIPITPGMVPPLYPTSQDNTPPSSQSPVCWAASSTYDCPFNLGTLCWTSVSGKQICQTNTKDNTSLNTCTDLLKQGRCGAEHSECASGATGYGNFCYVTNYTLDCPSAVQVPNISSETTYPCAGTIRCMGNDCGDDIRHEDSKGFADMQAKLNFVQHALSDVSVVGTSSTTSAEGNAQTAQARTTANNDPGQPKAYLFPGNAYECRKVLGSTVDFCTEAGSAPNQMWFSLYTQNERQANARKAVDQANQNQKPAQGSWARLRDKGNWNVQTVQQGFTSPQETVNEDMPDGSQNTLQPATNGLGNSTSLTPVMDEYRKEQMGNQSMVQNWAGTRAELDLAVQRAAGACVNIGSYCKKDGIVMCLEKRDVYCCFNSAMSKQIQVTMAGGDSAVTNGAFGSPEHPQCGGIPANEMTGQALQNMNYDDWEARSQEAGALPTLSNIQSKYSMDNLTGEGSSMVANTPTKRPNLLVRTQARVASLDTAGIRKAVEAQTMADQPPPPQDPDVPGAITLSPAYYYVAAGVDVSIIARRSGGKGAVSVNYATADNTAVAGADYTAATGTLQWQDGDTSEKKFNVSTVRQQAPASAPPKRFLIALSSPVGGASLGANVQGTVDINALPLPGTTDSGPGQGSGGNGGGSSSAPGFLSQFWPQSWTWLLTYGQPDSMIATKVILTLTNNGTMPAQSVVLTIQSPGGQMQAWGDSTDPLWQAACGNAGLAVGSAQASCAAMTPISPGATLTVPFVVWYAPTYYGATVNMTCQVSYKDTASPQNNYSIDPTQCAYHENLPNPNH